MKDRKAYEQKAREWVATYAQPGFITEKEKLVSWKSGGFYNVG